MLKKVKKELTSATHYDSEQFMDVVSTKHEKIYGNEDQTVVVIDTGAKNAIIRNIRELGYKAILVPWNISYEELMSHNPKGVVLSSGPGDPQKCPDTIDSCKKIN